MELRRCEERRDSELSSLSEWTLVDRVELLEDMSDGDSIEVIHDTEPRSEQEESEEEETSEEEEESSEEEPAKPVPVVREEQSKPEPETREEPPHVLYTPHPAVERVEEVRLPERSRLEKEESRLVEISKMGAEGAGGGTRWSCLAVVVAVVAVLALASTSLADDFLSPKRSEGEKLSDVMSELSGFKGEVQRLQQELADMHNAYRLVKEQQSVLKGKQSTAKQNGEEDPAEEKGGGGLGGFGSLGDLGERMGNFGGDIISKYLGYVWNKDNRQVIYTEEDLGEIREALGVLQGGKGSSNAGKRGLLGSALVDSLLGDMDLVKKLGLEPGLENLARAWSYKFNQEVHELQTEISLKIDKIAKGVVKDLVSLHSKFVRRLCVPRYPSENPPALQQSRLHSEFCQRYCPDASCLDKYHPEFGKYAFDVPRHDPQFTRSREDAYPPRREERYCNDPRGCPPQQFDYRDEADFKNKAKKKRGEMKNDNGKEERRRKESKSKKSGGGSEGERGREGGGSSGEWFGKYGEGRSKQRREHQRSDWLFERARHRQAS